jgi:hypothetical protein
VSSEPVAGRTLASYLVALLGTLDAHDPGAGRRIRGLAEQRSARIQLDDEVVLVAFRDGTLTVAPDDPLAPVDGSGRTDRATVLDLLSGRIEAGSAVLTGRVEILGAPDDVARLLQIIEVLLDAAPRTPALQLLERELVTAYDAPPSRRPPPGPAWYPDETPSHEHALLARLGLLREEH